MSRMIDMRTYARREHFDYFRKLPYPYMGVTADTDVTALVRFCREKGYSFYTAFIHVAALAADGVPQFRQRIRGDGIIEYDRCPTSHVEPLENGAYCFCTLHHDMDAETYFACAEEIREKARKRENLGESEDTDDMYFVSCLPWLRYTQLTQPTGNDSNPRITWGKYEADFRGRLMMPVSVLAHHALMDGAELAQFYRGLDLQMRMLCGTDKEN